jgi:hypothetical protein
MKATPAERFWAKVDKSGECWEWTAFKDRDGYGKFPHGFPGQQYAHRIAYFLLVGPIETGTQIDHKCHNRGCVNPSHLRPATNQENGQNLRGARRTSKSGELGVCWRADAQKWHVTVKHDGHSRHVGYYSDIEEAKAASAAARAALFTHFQPDQGVS